MLDYLADKAKIQAEKAEKASRALNEALSLSLPERGLRIEAYDISNTGGVDSVGAMVVFEDGRPLRKAYRRFKIKTIEGPDDTGSLQEVIYRRMKRGLSGDPGFDRMPHLILMDGGKNQVNAARQVLAAMNVDIPVAGMVKDDRHRTRGLILEEQEVELKGFPGLFHYIAAIQEEVHRFAIEYHRGLRTKKLQRSRLDEIEGVGEKRRNALLSHFGSIDEIAGAGVEELLEVPGMNRKAAEMVKRHFAVSYTHLHGLSGKPGADARQFRGNSKGAGGRGYPYKRIWAQENFKRRGPGFRHGIQRLPQGVRRSGPLRPGV